MNKKRIIFGILTCIWCYVIFSFSHSSGESSGSLSLKITHWILSVVYPMYDQKNLPIVDIFHFIIRKGAHMTEYAILYFLTQQLSSTFNIKLKWSFLYPLFFCVGYAFLDEFHQLFIQGRAGKIMDVFIDSCGAVLMMGVMYLFYKYRTKRCIRNKTVV